MHGIVDLRWMESAEIDPAQRRFTAIICIASQMKRVMVNSETLLIVDDSPDDSNFLNRILTADGFQTITESSGKEALGKSESECPRLALLDVLLPDMMGYDVCKIIRQNPHTALLPVIYGNRDGS